MVKADLSHAPRDTPEWGQGPKPEESQLRGEIRINFKARSGKLTPHQGGRWFNYNWMKTRGRDSQHSVIPGPTTEVPPTRHPRPPAGQEAQGAGTPRPNLESGSPREESSGTYPVLGRGCLSHRLQGSWPHLVLAQGPRPRPPSLLPPPPSSGSSLTGEKGPNLSHPAHPFQLVVKCREGAAFCGTVLEAGGVDPRSAPVFCLCPSFFGKAAV